MQNMNIKYEWQRCSRQNENRKPNLDFKLITKQACSRFLPVNLTFSKVIKVILKVVNYNGAQINSNILLTFC